MKAGGIRRVVLLGAGASMATHSLPGAIGALRSWRKKIPNAFPLLRLALEKWVGPDWVERNLEEAWGRIDVARNERLGATSSASSTEDLSLEERARVWTLVRAAAQNERDNPSYYRMQARRGDLSAEQLLSVVAGWNLRSLIQQEFSPRLVPEKGHPYGAMLDRIQPSAVISFNYDTLFEQFMDVAGRRWTYEADVTTDRVLVLKPHGAVNWTHVVTGSPDFGDRVLGLQLRSEDMGYQSSHGGDPWLFQNLVVGLRPKWEHGSAERSVNLSIHFASILKACQRELASADALWVIGYGFPRADTTFMDVIARAIAGRSAPAVRVITKQSADTPELLERLRGLFARKAVLNPYLKGFEEWAKRTR
jgi:hypothetical protein